MTSPNGPGDVSDVVHNEPYVRDPWVHRSAGMRCSGCMWFCPKVRDDGTESPLGRCRKYAPSMKGFVPVYMTDWCGDHRLSENKV